MKKRYLVLSLLFCLVLGCFAFAGCTGTPNTFEIEVKSLHYNLGSIEGENGKYTEGETMTIKAIPMNTSTTKTEFICWLLNNKVVSKDAEYSFVVSKNTAGNYLALFTCPYLEYISIDSLTLSSGIEESQTTTHVKQIDIYMGTIENLLTKIYSTSSETFDNKIELTSNDIYSDEKNPYAFDIQENMYLKIEVTFEQDDDTFISTTTTVINAKEDITANEFMQENINLEKAVNPDNSDHEINLNNESTLTLNFVRLNILLQKINPA